MDRALSLDVPDYLRNRVLDARNFFDGATKPKYVRNQFGATAGGPVRHDRAFFFASYEGLEERRIFTRLASTPTDAERAGVIDGFFDTCLEFIHAIRLTRNAAIAFGPIARGHVVQHLRKVVALKQFRQHVLVVFIRKQIFDALEAGACRRAEGDRRLERTPARMVDGW